MTQKQETAVDVPLELPQKFVIHLSRRAGFFPIRLVHDVTINGYTVTVGTSDGSYPGRIEKKGDTLTFYAGDQTFSWPKKSDVVKVTTLSGEQIEL